MKTMTIAVALIALLMIPASGAEEGAAKTGADEANPFKPEGYVAFRKQLP